MLQRHTVYPLADLKFFTGGFIRINSTECYVQRSGYTGEDGFEVRSLHFVAIDSNLAEWSRSLCRLLKWRKSRDSCSRRAK